MRKFISLILQARLIIVFIIVLMITMFSGCKQEKSIRFCEGVDSSGESINCGGKFSTGELSLIIESKQSFGTGKIHLNIYETGKTKKVMIESLAVDVKSGENSASTRFYFYEEGVYTVEALNENNEKIGEGIIEVLDVY